MTRKIHSRVFAMFLAGAVSLSATQPFAQVGESPTAHARQQRSDTEGADARALIDALTRSLGRTPTSQESQPQPPENASGLGDIGEALKLLENLGGQAGASPPIPLLGVPVGSKPASTPEEVQSIEDCGGTMFMQMLDMLLGDAAGFIGLADTSNAMLMLDSFKSQAQLLLQMSQGNYCQTRTALMLFAVVYSLERRL